MNFVELADRTWKKCGLTGLGPVNVASEVSMHGRIVSYVQDAYTEIQQAHTNWAFLWKSADLTLTPAMGSTVLPATLALTDFNRFARVLVNTGAGYYPIELLKHHNYLELDNPGTGVPTKVALRPDGRFAFDTVATSDVSLRVEYYRSLHELSANLDVPIIPVDHHLTIMWKAVIAYANFDEEATVLAEATKEASRSMLKLEINQLPELTFKTSEFLS